MWNITSYYLDLWLSGHHLNFPVRTHVCLFTSWGFLFNFPCLSQSCCSPQALRGTSRHAFGNSFSIPWSWRNAEARLHLGACSVLGESSELFEQKVIILKKKSCRQDLERVWQRWSILKQKEGGNVSKSGVGAPKHIVKKQLGPQNPVSLQVRVTCAFQRTWKEVVLPYHLEYTSSWTSLMMPQKTTMWPLPQLQAFHFDLDF